MPNTYFLKNRADLLRIKLDRFMTRIRLSDVPCTHRNWNAQFSARVHSVRIPAFPGISALRSAQLSIYTAVQRVCPLQSAPAIPLSPSHTVVKGTDLSLHLQRSLFWSLSMASSSHPLCLHETDLGGWRISCSTFTIMSSMQCGIILLLGPFVNLLMPKIYQ